VLETLLEYRVDLVLRNPIELEDEDDIELLAVAFTVGVSEAVPVESGSTITNSVLNATFRSTEHCESRLQCSA
jgi:hypothetical protein